MSEPIGSAGREAAAMGRVLMGRWLRKSLVAELVQPDDEDFGQGSALPPATRRLMEALFERDLSEVRTFKGERVAKLGGMLAADAFTVGSNVYLPTGDETEQLPLLAHELTHVVQQQQPALTPAAVPAEAPTLREAGNRAEASGAVAPLIGRDARADTVPHLPVQVFEGTYLEDTPVRPQLATSGDPITGDASEAEAQANEATLARAGGQSGSPGIDAQEVAERVYRMMRDELLIDRERRVATRW